MRFILLSIFMLLLVMCESRELTKTPSNQTEDSKPEKQDEKSDSKDDDTDAKQVEEKAKDINFLSESNVLTKQKREQKRLAYRQSIVRNGQLADMSTMQGTSGVSNVYGNANPSSGDLTSALQRYSNYSPQQHNTESYAHLQENDFKNPFKDPLSTFSIDVDGASYSNARRFLRMGQLPPQDAVRVEEFINYFSYDYPEPDDDSPFSVTTELGKCPWNKDAQLLHIGLKGKAIESSANRAHNLTFLIDVSGSMNSPNKLGLLKKSFRLLVNQLDENDKVSIVVYAGSAGMVLKPTSGEDKSAILAALNRLNAGGSTAGGAGIKLAYNLANKHRLKHGNNRVILATDGDFNIGVSSEGGLARLIEKERNNGIYLTILGFGMGNYKDSQMELLSNKGNGNYAYIDNLLEAKKVFVNELGATLNTIAKDVKIQIEFNPKKVKSYRLVGYENRLLNREDFDNDKKDAGEIGSGHTVTALYEIIPNYSGENESSGLVFQQTEMKQNHRKQNNLAFLKLRYKKPDSESSILRTVDVGTQLSASQSTNFTFSAAAASFGLLLRQSKFNKQMTYPMVITMAKSSKGSDVYGYRAEFIQLVEMAELISRQVSHRE